MQEPQQTPTPGPAVADHLLEDLAALTSLFSPTQLWHAEELLHEIDKEEAAAAKATQ